MRRRQPGATGSHATSRDSARLIRLPTDLAEFLAVSEPHATIRGGGDRPTCPERQSWLDPSRDNHEPREMRRAPVSVTFQLLARDSSVTSRAGPLNLRCCVIEAVSPLCPSGSRKLLSLRSALYIVFLFRTHSSRRRNLPSTTATYDRLQRTVSMWVGLHIAMTPLRDDLLLHCSVLPVLAPVTLSMAVFPTVSQ